MKDAAINRYADTPSSYSFHFLGYVPRSGAVASHGSSISKI
jgi:hypothetical protein